MYLDDVSYSDAAPKVIYCEEETKYKKSILGAALQLLELKLQELHRTQVVGK